MSIIKKLLIVFVVVAVIVGGVIAAAVFRFDSTQVRKEVVDYIASSVSVVPKVKGDVSFSLLPSPRVSIKEVELLPESDDYDLALAVVPSIDAYISPLSFLLGQKNIEKIVLNNPVLNIELSRRGDWNWGLKESKSVNTTEMVLHYGIVNYYSQASDFYKRFEQVNMTIDAESLSGPFNVKGDFSVTEGIHNRYYSIDAMVTVDGRTMDLGVVLGSEHFDLNYQGDVERLDDGVLKSDGDVEITGSSFPDFFWTFFSGEAQMLKGGGRRYSADDPFTIRARMTNGRSHMDINDITITSQTLVGKGKVKSFLGRKTVTEVDLDIEYIGLDHLLGASNGWHMSIGDIVIPEQSIIANIKIDELSYLVDKATDISVELQSAGRAVEIKPLIAYLPGKGKIEFAGDFHKLHWNTESDSLDRDDDLIRQSAVPILQGEFYGSGEKLRSIMDWFQINSDAIKAEKLGNYSLHGKVRVAPYVIEVHDIKALVDDVFFRGSSQISHSIGRTKVLNKVNVERFNIDEYLDTAKYTDNFDPARFFRRFTQSDMDIYFESDVSQLIMNDSVVNDLFFILAVNPASVGFDRISMRSENADFDGSMILDLRGIDPVVKLELDASHLDTKIFRKSVSEVSKDPSAEGGKVVAKSLWSQEPLNIAWLTRFNGDVDIRMESLQHNDLVLNNLIFLGKMKDFVLRIDTFTAQLADGTLELKGKVIGTSIPTFGVSFSVTKADIKTLMKSLFGYDMLDGKFSLVGSIGSSGFTMERLIAQMYGSFSFAARGVEITGINLHHLVDNLFSVPEERVLDLVAENLSSGKTELYAADGIFTIKAGLLSIKEMVMSTTRTSGAMSGNFDLKTWVLALISNFSFIAYDPVVGENATLSLGIKVSGTADKPKVDNNFRTIDRYFKRRAEEQKLKKRVN